MTRHPGYAASQRRLAFLALQIHRQMASVSAVKFAADSALEEAGFEPSVPRKAPGVRVALGSRSRRRMSVGRNYAQAT